MAIEVNYSKGERVTMDFDYEFIKSLAQRDYNDGWISGWESFKEECEDMGFSYECDFDEGSYDVYYEEYKRLCLENNDEETLAQLEELQGTDEDDDDDTD